jgi:hypothetical protein
MDSTPANKAAQIVMFFDGIGIDAPELLQSLSPYMEIVHEEQTEAPRPSGAIETVYLDDKEFTGKSEKWENVIVYIKRAIAAKDTEKLVNVLELYPGFGSFFQDLAKLNAQEPFGISIAAVQLLILLYKLKKIETIELSRNEAILLSELFRLDVEENTVRRADVPALVSHKLTDAQIDRALLNLERLGCIKLSMDEIILIEKIKIRSNQRPRPAES